MRFDKIRLNGRKLSSKGKVLGAGLGLEAVPLIELHRYSRISETQIGDEEDEWTPARALDISARRPGETFNKKEKRRTKILNIIFPSCLGDLATAWRLQIETANGLCIPLVQDPIAMPRPTYSVGRNRQRGGSFRFGSNVLGRVDEEEDSFIGGVGVGGHSSASTSGGMSKVVERTTDVKGKGLNKRTGSGEDREMRKSKTRYVFQGEEVREFVDTDADIDTGNGEGLSRAGTLSTSAAWRRAASHGVFP